MWSEPSLFKQPSTRSLLPSRKARKDFAEKSEATCLHNQGGAAEEPPPFFAMWGQRAAKSNQTAGNANLPTDGPCIGVGSKLARCTRKARLRQNQV